MPISTHLTLIRHGHTASNSEGGALLSGRTDVPLTARGREEVRLLGEHLLGSPPFVAIYASPLRRALDTARILEQAGLGPIRLCPSLQEIDCGSLDGMPLGEVQRRFPELWVANLRQNDDRFRWPNGESYRELRCRSLRAVRAIALAHRGERIALVTHAGVISQVLGALAGEPAARWELHRPATASVSEIVWQHGTGRVLSFSERSYLPSDR